MRQETRNDYSPDRVSAPGETLTDILESRSMSQSELAERTGRPKKTINEIINGKAAITSETAVQLERVLGVPAEFWTTREAQYRAHLAREDEAKRLERFAAWSEKFPIAEMSTRGWIKSAERGVPRVREVLSFFGVATPEQFDVTDPTRESRFRVSTKFEVDRFALAAWLRRGELEAQDAECAPFDRERFLAALHDVRGLTRTEPDVFVPKLKSICSATGVVVAFVPELPRTRANGATRWISPTRALIQLSLRYGRNDVLWFTFFHEAGHIALHGKKEVFIENAGMQSAKEEEANQFASEWLITSKDLKQFLARGDFTRQAVMAFADRIGVHPGLVVGRLQHEGAIAHSMLTDLIMRLEWAKTAKP